MNHILCKYFFPLHAVIDKYIINGINMLKERERERDVVVYIWRKKKKWIYTFLVEPVKPHLQTFYWIVCYNISTTHECPSVTVMFFSFIVQVLSSFVFLSIFGVGFCILLQFIFLLYVVYFLMPDTSSSWCCYFILSVRSFCFVDP